MVSAFADLCVATKNKHALRLEPVTQTQDEVALHPLLARRRSSRALGGEALPETTVTHLLEAARWAPSSANKQPWSFIVVRREDSAAHAAAADLLMSRNQLWASSAPLLIVAVARTQNPDGSAYPIALYDLGLAVAQLVVQATAEGLAAHQMGGFDKTRARAVFAIPEGWEPVTVIAIGHAGSPEDVHEELRAAETASRSRRPLAEMAFEGRFGQPLGTPQPRV